MEKELSSDNTYNLHSEFPSEKSIYVVMARGVNVGVFIVAVYQNETAARYHVMLGQKDSKVDMDYTGGISCSRIWFSEISLETTEHERDIIKLGRAMELLET